MKNGQKTKNLIYMAMYLALAFVFDWIANTMDLFKMPDGGVLGLGVVPLLLASYHLGWKKGVVTGLLFVVLKGMRGDIYLIQNSDGFAVWQIFIQFMMEYPLAFGIYGIACLFPNYRNFYSGIVITNLIRLALHTVAGTIFWATPWWGSFTYNAWYMIPTMILCMILVPIVMRRVRPYVKRSQ